MVCQGHALVYLYRDAVPGHPELNVMQTDLEFKEDKLNFLAPPHPVPPSRWPSCESPIPCATVETHASTSDFGQTVPPGTLAKDRMAT